MSDFLQTIAEQTLADLKLKKQKIPEAVLQMRIEQMTPHEPRSLFSALKRPGTRIIAELKKASPSLGVIRKDFPYESIALEYEKSGAAAISVLTEPHYFLGSTKILSDVAEKAGIPVLRKDFIMEPYQLLEAKAAGADAVLLIAALIKDDRTFQAMMHTAQGLGLEVLCEAHTEQEVTRLIGLGAMTIGVNCRDLHTFKTDLRRAAELLEMIPDDHVSVSESGIRSSDDLMNIRADAFLIGEAFMRMEHPGELLKILCAHGAEK